MTRQSFITRLAAWRLPAAFADDARAEARLALLDTLACLLAGREEPQTVAALAAMRGGAAPGGGFSVQALALLNGTAAHALDFDDYEVPGSTHPSAPVLGALLALGATREVTLGTLLDAWLAGYETIARFGEALGYGHYLAGWHSTATIGTFGAAAAAARALALDVDATTRALALAASRAAGLKAQFGTDAKALHAGFAAATGVECALLAAAGAGAAVDVLEAADGFFSRHAGAGSPGFASAARRLGERPAVIEYPVLRKPWPCCAYTHRAIEAAMAIAAEPGFDASRVDTVTVRVPAPYARVAGIERPRVAAEARFSLTHCVATALLDGEVSAASFTPAAVGGAAVTAFRERVRVDAWDAGPDLVDMSPAAPDTVRVCFLDGTVAERTVAEVKGGMTRPLSRDDLHAKFIACGGTPALADRVLAGDAGQPFRFVPFE